jgi:hypothetical protein
MKKKDIVNFASWLNYTTPWADAETTANAWLNIRREQKKSVPASSISRSTVSRQNLEQ